MAYKLTQKFIISPPDRIPGNARIHQQDARHIIKTLRMEIGNKLNLTDGSGTDYNGTITDISGSTVTVSVSDAKPSSSESSLRLTLCCAMLKDKKMETVIRQATQLGIHEWIPFYSERTIPKPDHKKSSKKIDRWKDIARESLKQCKRSCVPEIHAPISFDAMLKTVDNTDHKLAFWEKAAQPLQAFTDASKPASAAVLIGPEGGFSQNEILLAQASGFTPYLIGPRILRAETAAIVCCALVQHLLGDM